MIPALGDAHIHVTDVGWGKEILDLHESRDPETFKNLLNAYLKSEKWESIKNSVNCLEALGWWEENELPTLAEIDEILPEIPAIFHRRCLHIVYMNSAAIKILGFNDPNFIADPKVEIVRDSTGKATGILREGFNLVRKSSLKKCTLETQKRYIKNGLNACVQAGLTQVHACEGKWLQKNAFIIFQGSGIDNFRFKPEVPS